MKDYSKMSDFEVNGYVSMYEHGFSWIEFDDEMSSHVKCGNEGSPGFSIVEVKGYCNNPSDAWPIIKTNHINIGWAGDEEWFARTVHTAKVFDVNPLRCAMIVYLMMKDEEQ